MTGLKIQDLKSQIAGATRAREAAERRALLAGARAEKAERAEREASRTILDLRQQLQQISALLQSQGVRHD